MEIITFANEVNKLANERGWWDFKRSLGDIIALCHSELSEALEEYRNGHSYNEIYEKNGKPEGIPIELADCIIRILDFCKQFDIDIDKALSIKHEFNKKREYRHGGKKI